MMFNDNDRQQMSARGITESMIEAQLKQFENGFPWLKIKAAATVGNGIVRLDTKQQFHYLRVWKEFQASGATIEKFQPASGAASRMFKELFNFLDEARLKPETEYEKKFFSYITKFAFFPELNRHCLLYFRENISEIVKDGRYYTVVESLLLPAGLNYGALPKALLIFHRDGLVVVHTALEEHLEEGVQYAMDRDRVVRVHFTVSPEHRQAFEELIDKRVPFMEKLWRVKFDITLSEQKSTTDTIAANMDNTPYRNFLGNIVLRPGGHGALIENLNERDADMLYIKNIDNIVPLRHRGTSVRFKKVLGGYLVTVRRQLKEYLETLDHGNVDSRSLQEMLRYARETLCIDDMAVNDMDDEALAQWLHGKFNRPVRVCGVVRNEGEPGGGPYIAYNADGSTSPQILEAAQINPNDPEAVEIMRNGTHFNPVDIVCCIKDYKGIKFDLRKFVDPDTGFISIKSKDGREFKALELPGLWNGAMSDWNTILVEVPVETFTPVKTVNDLLRSCHQ